MARSVEDLTAADVVLPAPVLTLAPEARDVVKSAIAEEADPERLALWLEVRGVANGGFSYDLYFQAASDATDDDAVQHDDDVPVVVPASSIDRLRGARLEWSEENGGGLVLVNPNTPSAAELNPGIPDEVLAAGVTGALAVRVADVLEQQVNPSIAGHGGRSDLVAVDESEGVAYIRLSGGCQGCSMSRMTLTQGIEVALKEHVSEIKSVVDVTDHASGDNPYF